MSEYASNGKGNLGVTLGAIGTGLALIGNGGLGGIFGNWGRSTTVGDCYQQSIDGKIAEMESQLAAYQAEKYSDQVALEVYKAGVANYNKLDEKINNNLEKLYGFVIDLDKRTALNEQGLEYENKITNNRIDCCCDKANMQMAFNRQLAELADASIISYVNSNFLPGTLKLPITSVCPTPAVAQ